jgi:hypothetical protein
MEVSLYTRGTNEAQTSTSLGSHYHEEYKTHLDLAGTGPRRLPEMPNTLYHVDFRSAEGDNTILTEQEGCSSYLCSWYFIVTLT